MKHTSDWDDARIGVWTHMEFYVKALTDRQCQEWPYLVVEGSLFDVSFRFLSISLKENIRAQVRDVTP